LLLPSATLARPQDAAQFGAAPRGSGLHLVTLPLLLQMHPEPEASFKAKPNLLTHNKSSNWKQYQAHLYFESKKKKSVLSPACYCSFSLPNESIFKLRPREVLNIRYGEIHAGQGFTHWHSPSVPPPC